MTRSTRRRSSRTVEGPVTTRRGRGTAARHTRGSAPGRTADVVLAVAWPPSLLR